MKNGDQCFVGQREGCLQRKATQRGKLYVEVMQQKVALHFARTFSSLFLGMVKPFGSLNIGQVASTCSLTPVTKALLPPSLTEHA
jgi:hypothetical protein